MSGKAAAIVHQVQSGSTRASKLLLVTVEGKTTTTDTVLTAASGKTYSYPTFNNAGTKIAFYENNDGRVSVYDIAGKSVRTVAKIPNWSGPGQEQRIAWPGADEGKWIYYHKPCSQGGKCRGGGTGEIWKVNIDDTTRNMLVCDYKTVDSSASFIDFALSADGRYCVIRGIGDPNVPDALGYGCCIRPHTFPPKVNTQTGWIDPGLTAPGENPGLIGWQCNSGISASGNLLCCFRALHTALYGVSWNHEADTLVATNPPALFDMFKDLEPWMGSNYGDSPYLFMPRGSSNADKIFTILVLWENAQNFSNGSNLAVINWKDRDLKDAVMVTRSPLLGLYTGNNWIAEAGDFHLNGGPANSYQDINGQWISLPTVTESRGGDRPVLRFSQSMPGTDAAIYSITGRREGDFRGGDLLQPAPGHLHIGAYIIAGQGTAARRVVAGNKVQRTHGEEY